MILSWVNNWWSVCHSSSSSIHGWPLKYNTSMAGSFCFLTQFMKFQDLWFLDVISWILLLKNTHLVFLTEPLKTFQSSIGLDILYFASFVCHFLFHQTWKYFMILIHFECFYHMRSKFLANSWTVSSSDSLSTKWKVLIYFEQTLQ